MSSSDLPNTLLPSHVAIIMDGNRRWAAGQNKQANDGHRAGFERFKEIVQLCFDKGVKYVTVYAFSTENWKRTDEEVGALMGLMSYAVKNEVKNYKKKNIRVNIIGRRNDLSPELQSELAEIEAETHDKDGNVLNVAISYGGKNEIVDAVRVVLASGAEVTTESIAKNLYTKDQPNPELVIRTGGEHRLSNFLLWQTDYSELYFTDTLWPDFDETQLDTALNFFSKQKRNFGK
jgi:undecaprenyl diphosphate synthase